MISDSLRVDGIGKGVTVVDHSTRSRAPNSSLFGGQARTEPKKLKELKALKKAAESQLEILKAEVRRDASHWPHADAMISPSLTGKRSPGVCQNYEGRICHA